MKQHLVAVYGTLKRGFSNNYILKQSNYLGDYTTEPKFTMYDLGFFPAVVPNGNTAITVEIYAVDKQTLQRLYTLEGFSGNRASKYNFYTTMDLDTPWGRAEMFIFASKITTKDNAEVIKDGTWKY